MSRIENGRFVVTGGAGFIGSYLVDALLAARAARVVVIDNFFLGKDENLAAAAAAHGDRLVVYRDDAGIYLYVGRGAKDREAVFLAAACWIVVIAFLRAFATVPTGRASCQ